MPSLKVSKCKDKNTFQHFYNSVVHVHSADNSNTKHNLVIILKIIAVSIATTCCIYLLGNAWPSIIVYNYHNIYVKYHLVYLYDWIVYVFFVFVSLLFVNHVFMNGYYNYSLKHNIFITLIVCLFINGTIVTVLLWQYPEYHNFIWYSKWICKHVLMNNSRFQSRCKFSFSIFGLYLFAFVYPFCLFLIIVLNCLIFSACVRHSDQIKTKQDFININSYDAPIEYEMKDLNESLINIPIPKHENLKTTIILKEKLKYSFCLYICFNLEFFFSL